MNQLCELNDRVILGQEGRSAQKPRVTARAIVRNQDGRYAVMHSMVFQLYTLPGGGVEHGETVLEALQREISEETGCSCRRIQELGMVAENRASLDYTQINHYYVVDAVPGPRQIHLTEDERASRTNVEWHSWEEMLALISQQKADTVQRKYLKARDLAALQAYEERMIP